MNRNHPYQRHYNNNNNYNNRREKSKWLISNDFLTAHYLIHPHSIHNSSVDLFEKPNEIGQLLSKSKLHNFFSHHKIIMIIHNLTENMVL